MSPQNVQLKAAIYARVSKDKRRDVRSVGEQEAANVTHCEQRGWKVSEVFTDNDRSASRFARKARPDWERLVEDLQEERFDVLVLWEPSRGDRELEMWARLLTTCRRSGILIHITSHDRTYDVRKPRDWRTLAEDGVDSHYESEKVSERIRRATRANAAEGRPHGGRLYGYDRFYDPSSGKLIGQRINEEEAAIIRHAAELVVQGMTLRGIAKGLNECGIPGPRADHWAESTIKRMLMRPAYIGYRVHFEAKIQSPQWFPPILDERTHHLCVAKLASPDRRQQRPSAIKHLLSGLAACGVCGGPVRVTNNRHRKPSYICRSAVADGSQRGHVLREKVRTDKFVEGLVIGILQRPDVLSLTGRTNWADDLLDVLGEIERERAELESFYVKAEAGELSAEALARVEAARLPKIRAAEARAQQVQGPPSVEDLVVAGPGEVPSRWGHLEVAQKRDILRGFFEKIEIMPVHSRYYTDAQSVKVTKRWADS